MELEQTVQRGDEARQILNSPIFIDRVASLKAKYTNDMLRSNESDSIKREQLFMKIRVLDEIVDEIGITEQGGRKAEKDLKVRKARQTNKGVL